MLSARSITRMRSRGNYIAAYLALCLFIFSCIIYYIIASGDYESGNVFGNFANLHDHDVYLLNIDIVKSGESIFELGNDKGIASIYIFLSNIFPFLVTPDMYLLAFVFNCIILVSSFKVYIGISDALSLGLLGKLSFFVNLSLLYFSQLINKDMLTIFVFLLAAYASIQGRHWFLLLLIPFAVYIRIQLVIFILIFIFLSSTKRLGARFLVTYILTSLLAAYLSVYFSIIGEDSLGDGFSAYLIDLNNEYLIGYLIFNPVRLVQYVFDAYLSFYVFNEYGLIDVAKVLRIPQLILLAMLSPYFFKIFTHWNIYSKSISRPLVITVLAYLCTWLMNPTVNARYVMLITPLLVLLGLYLRKTRCNV